MNLYPTAPSHTPFPPWPLPDADTPPPFLTKWDLSVLDPSPGQYLENHQLCCHLNLGPIWDTSYSNELGHLCQGVRKGPTSTGQRTKGTDTFHVIRFNNIPRNRRKGVNFTKLVCKFCCKKEDLNSTRITIMGNRVVYTGDVSTKTASLNL